MRAALFRQHGGPEVMEVAEVPDPVPGPGQVLVRIRAAALNHLDLWVRRGLPALKVAFPHVLGGDACGVVAGLGPGAQGVKEGDRVVINPGLTCGRCARCLSGHDNLCAQFKMVGEHTWGVEAELIALPAVNVALAPPGPSDAELAAIPITYMTAWQMLIDKARVERHETVLVMAAGSGVGVAAIQIAKLQGAHVIAASSSDDKLARARALGADETVRYGEGIDLGAELKRMTGRKGVDVVIESLGGPLFPVLVRALAQGGRLVTCGNTAGWEATIDLRYVFWRQLSILGSTIAPKSHLLALLRLVGEGKLKAIVDRVLPLDQVVEAHRVLEGRGAFGKVVLQIGDGG
jgi:NADPH:quinone reductase-like Zn-dependent oxidoreductase